jgi:chemotaxis methyl-accepting protein methylase
MSKKLRLQMTVNTGSGRIKIFASDLSSRVLKPAERGAYLAERFCDCPQDRLRKYLLGVVSPNRLNL